MNSAARGRACSTMIHSCRFTSGWGVADLVKWSVSFERGPVHGGAALGCAALGGDKLGGDGLGCDWLGGDGLRGDGIGGDGRRRILLLHCRQGSARRAVGVFWRR